MLLLTTEQAAANNALLKTLSVMAADGVNPKSTNTMICKTEQINHQTANAALNLTSDKEDIANALI
jgi:hypothetical protein